MRIELDWVLRLTLKLASWTDTQVGPRILLVSGWLVCDADIETTQHNGNETTPCQSVTYILILLRRMLPPSTSSANLTKVIAKLSPVG
jgi:hypothetical protein